MEPPRVRARNAAWRRDTFHSPDDFTLHLGEEVVAELQANAEHLDPENQALRDSAFIATCLPAFTETSRKVRHILDEGIGFTVIDGLAALPVRHQVAVFCVLANLLGEPMRANAQGSELVEVRDLGGSLAEGARYHQTNDGGSYHTDSPQWSETPAYVGLLCLRAAKLGGESAVVSASSVLHELSKRFPAAIAILARPFHFDKRGDLYPGEQPTTYAPIISTASGDVHLRYLRDYVDAGHARVGTDLTEEQRSALIALDTVIADTAISVHFLLCPGQIELVNNRAVLHGRSSFESEEGAEGGGRLLLRVWIRRSEAPELFDDAIGMPLG